MSSEIIDVFCYAKTGAARLGLAHGHVIYFAPDAASQRDLSRGRVLIVKSAKRGLFDIKRRIALGDVWVLTLSFEFSLAERASKEITMIGSGLQFDNMCSLQVGCNCMDAPVNCT